MFADEGKVFPRCRRERDFARSSAPKPSSSRSTLPRFLAVLRPFRVSFSRETPLRLDDTPSSPASASNPLDVAVHRCVTIHASNKLHSVHCTIRRVSYTFTTYLQLIPFPFFLFLSFDRVARHNEAFHKGSNNQLLLFANLLVLENVELDIVLKLIN